MARDRVDTAEHSHLLALARPIVIFQVIEGLRRGLCRYLGQTRVALLMASDEADPLMVFDPHDLLGGHRAALKAYYQDSNEWRNHPQFSRAVGEAYNCRGPETGGLICWGRQSSSVFYQMWFAESPLTLSSPGPVEEWLAKASWILTHELALGTSLFTSSATHTLESYSLYAVSDYVLGQLRKYMRMEPGFRVEDVLKSIAAVSTTYEEGRRPTGALMFLNPKTMAELPGLVPFDEGHCPAIKDHKHVAKLLAMVEDTSRFLVSDGQSILGIGHGSRPDSALLVTFRDGHGEVQLGAQTICTLKDGDFSGLGRMPQLQELESALERKGSDVTVRAKVLTGVMNLVQRAWVRRHGCTIVLDFGQPPRPIGGQLLTRPLPVIENLDLLEGMARIDGALHIDSNCELHAFACLLDGKAVPEEDRSRGARYNSALRFTADYPAAVAVVVSADGPVAILEGGRQINQPRTWAACDRVYMEPPSLDGWLNKECWQVENVIVSDTGGSS